MWNIDELFKFTEYAKISCKTILTWGQVLLVMGLLSDTQNCGLRMRRECRERFSPPPWVSDPDMHHGTCVVHVPWCISGSLTNGFLSSEVGGGENGPGIPGTCATHNFAYLVRGPWEFSHWLRDVRGYCTRRTFHEFLSWLYLDGNFVILEVHSDHD